VKYNKVVDIFNQYWSQFLSLSESATINAPVEDEAIQAILGMNQKHILPYPKFLVFSTSSLTQSFSLLLTSPSYLPQLILCSFHH
jgi:hypothetical protein